MSIMFDFNRKLVHTWDAGLCQRLKCEPLVYIKHFFKALASVLNEDLIIVLKNLIKQQSQ